jgi:hypothetical protein
MLALLFFLTSNKDTTKKIGKEGHRTATRPSFHFALLPTAFLTPLVLLPAVAFSWRGNRLFCINCIKMKRRRNLI